MVTPSRCEHHRVAKLAGRAADALATLAAGVRGALTLARTREPALVEALFRWAFATGRSSTGCRSSPACSPTFGLLRTVGEWDDSEITQSM